MQALQFTGSLGTRLHLSLRSPFRSHYEEAEQVYVQDIVLRDRDMHFHINLGLVISSCLENGFHPSSLGIRNHTTQPALEQGLQLYQQHNQSKVRKSTFVLRGSLFRCTIFLPVCISHDLKVWMVDAGQLAVSKRWRGR